MAAAEAEAEKKFTLQSSDGAEFVVEESVAVQSETIKNMFEEGCDGVIPLANVNSRILALVIEYCTHHARTKAANADRYCKDTDADKEFDKKFVDVDQDTLFDLILMSKAANYLDIKDLLDLTCETVASMIRGKKPEEIRKTFHIKNDLTKEEEEEIRKEYHWAFE